MRNFILALTVLGLVGCVPMGAAMQQVERAYEEGYRDGRAGKDQPLTMQKYMDDRDSAVKRMNAQD